MTLNDVCDVFRDHLPKHDGGLILTHNPQHSNYETVEQYVKWRQGEKDWVSDEHRDKAIAADDMWELQWYPDTPLGFCILFAADLPALLNKISKDDQ